MKKYLFLAAAALTLASCANDDYLGNKEDINGEYAIGFNSKTGAITRAALGHTESAAALNNQFIVYGTKHTTAAEDKTASNDQAVFQNYVVAYTASTANQSVTNTEDWEYVGKGVSGYLSNVTPALTDASLQDVKYWDYAAANGYTFYAFSALPADLTSGAVKVTKITTDDTAEGTVYTKGYNVTLTAAAHLDDLYFADRMPIGAGTGSDRYAHNQYGGQVNFTFRNAGSKVRVAMYEMIPGYTVTIDKFYYADAADPAFSAMTTAGTDKFYANVPNVASGTAGTLKVTYYDNTVAATENHPKVSFTGTAANYIALGTNLKATTVLSTNNTTPTYDQSAGEYTSVFPQEANTQNMKVKLDYTLTSTDGSGETIKVTGATAEVPAKYLQWKANFAYTYVFKINDNTNGQIGTHVGLYPITFDGVIEQAADNATADYITTVSEPSITTFAVSGGKYVKAGDDYTAGVDVYATFMEGSVVKAGTLNSGSAQGVHVYKMTDTNVTEAQAAEWIANNITAKYTDVCTDGTTNFTAAPAIVATVPGEDGSTVTISALKLTGVKAGTYAIEYKASSTWTGTYDKVYKIVKVQ